MWRPVSGRGRGQSAVGACPESLSGVAFLVERPGVDVFGAQTSNLFPVSLIAGEFAEAMKHYIEDKRTSVA